MSSYLCHGCLSTDRNMIPVKDLQESIQVAAMKDIFQEKAFLCWECTAILRKFSIFRIQVKNVQGVIALMKKMKSFESLTNLCITENNAYDYCFNHDVDIQKDDEHLLVRMKEELSVIGDVTFEDDTNRDDTCMSPDPLDDTANSTEDPLLSEELQIKPEAPSELIDTNDPDFDPSDHGSVSNDPIASSSQGCTSSVGKKRKVTPKNKIQMTASEKKPRKYTEDAMEKALADIQQGANIREACRLHQVARGTVYYRLNSDGPKKRGPGTKLGIETERELVEWLMNQSKFGFLIKKHEFLDTVQTSFTNRQPSQNWYLNFLKRHPCVALKLAENLTKPKEPARQELIRNWFSDLQKYLEAVNHVDILKYAERIFSAAGTEFTVCPKSGAVNPKGYRTVHQKFVTTDKESITVFVTFNANGDSCNPCVVYPRNAPPMRNNTVEVERLPPDWNLYKTETGNMQADVLYEFVRDVFLKWLDCKKIKTPVLLFIDGTKSLMSMRLSQMCEEKGVILYAVPPNTSHILQPVDCSFLIPLTLYWRTTVAELVSDDPKKSVGKSYFCFLLKHVLDSANVKTNVKSGFEKCGIYPFSSDAVDYTKCIKR